MVQDIDFLLLKKYDTEIWTRLNVVNINRIKTLSIILFVANLLLIVLDFDNQKRGLWAITPGYILLFYNHIAFVLGTFSFVLIYIKKKNNLNDSIYFPKVYVICFTCFMLNLTAIISGWTDQLIHAQITVYVIGCFLIAVFYYQKPKYTILMYLQSYLCFLTYLNIVQKNADIRQGHYINASLVVILACFISIIISRIMQRNFIYEHYLEDLVKERTGELQRTNEILTKEIYERKRAQDELDRFFEMLSDILIITDSKGNIKRCNPAYGLILGYTTEDIAAISVTKIIHPEDSPRMIASLQSQGISNKVEIRCRNKNGKYLWIEWLGVLDHQNDLIYSVARDVTEQKNALKKVLRLASIVESTNDGILGIDLDGIVLDWNFAAESIFGYPKQEMIGKYVGKVIPEEQQWETKDIFNRIKKGEHIDHFETKRCRKDGKIITVSLTVSPIIDANSNIIGTSTIVRDLTEKKGVEQELARLDRLNLIGEMAASISHEVRNPMTTVKGFLQLLRGKQQDPKHIEYFDIMVDELDRANSIITEFLTINRTKETIMEWNNINDIVTSILPLIEADALNNDLLLKTELIKVPDLRFNDQEIRQLVLNLARNGLEAMTMGGCLKIKTYSVDNDIVLTVEDEGTGIEQYLLEKIGTPFFTTKENGTGLGLAVCSGIISRHNGRLKIETSSKGSSFHVYFKVNSNISSAAD